MHFTSPSHSGTKHLEPFTPLSDVKPVVQLGFELKTGEKGDGLGSSEKAAINSAMSQVIRSTSGLIDNFYKTLPAAAHNNMSTYRFLPVIFTTAKLFVSHTDISRADLTTGKLPSDELQIEETD